MMLGASRTSQLRVRTDSHRVREEQIEDKQRTLWHSRQTIRMSSVWK